jgi:hypothetical protein
MYLPCKVYKYHLILRLQLKPLHETSQNTPLIEAQDNNELARVLLKSWKCKVVCDAPNLLKLVLILQDCHCHCYLIEKLTRMITVTL